MYNAWIGHGVYIVYSVRVAHLVCIVYVVYIVNRVYRAYTVCIVYIVCVGVCVYCL